jgi:hypothetical protein
MAVAPVSNTGLSELSWTRSLVSRLSGAIRDPITLCDAIEAVAAIVIPGGRGLFLFENRVWTILTSDDGSYQIVYAPTGECAAYRTMASCQVIQIVYHRSAGHVTIDQKTLDSVFCHSRSNVAANRHVRASSRIDPPPYDLFLMGRDLVGFRSPYQMTLLEFFKSWRDLQCSLRIMVCIASALEHLHAQGVSHGDVHPYYCRLINVDDGRAFLAMPLCPVKAFDRMSDWCQFVTTFETAIFGINFSSLSEQSDLMLIAFLKVLVKKQGHSEMIKFENMNDLMEVLRENSGDGVGWLYASLRAFVSVHQLLYQLACICQEAERMRYKFKPKTLGQLEAIYLSAADCFDLQVFVTREIERILKEYFRMCSKG